MQTDALGRRHKYAERPSPVVPRIVLQEADLLWFGYLDRHGYLPSRYLYEATRKLRPSLQGVQRRLTELINGETLDPRPYLFRPGAQRLAPRAKTQVLTYALTARGTAALGAAKCAVPPTQSASFPHQLMQSCVAFSFEMCAPSRGLRYIPRSEVLSSEKCGEAKDTRRPMAVPLPGDNAGRLTPDDIFALENAEGLRRFFILEVDRATESMRPRAEDRNLHGEKTTYFGEKIANYVRLFEAGQIKAWWGFNRPLVLIVTTTLTRKRQILEQLAALPAPISGRFLLKVEEAFGTDWGPPEGVLTHLLDGSSPWETIAGTKDIASP